MSNYQQLSEAELRTYVKTHPDDEEAFQHYLTIIKEMLKTLEKQQRSCVFRTSGKG